MYCRKQRNQNTEFPFPNFMAEHTHAEKRSHRAAGSGQKKQPSFRNTPFIPACIKFIQSIADQCRHIYYTQIKKQKLLP